MSLAGSLRAIGKVVSQFLLKLVYDAQSPRADWIQEFRREDPV